MEGPGGTVAHAELEIAGTLLMVADPFPQDPKSFANLIERETMRHQLRTREPAGGGQDRD
jgi:uncharacterized glyoxalase superfamily protein PhnB